MADWQAGDLALCVRGGYVAGPNKGCEHPRSGKIYTVAEVGIYPFWDGDKLGLVLGDGPTNNSGKRVWDAIRFRKVTPPKADEFDREVIDLMLGKPARVGADA